MLISPCKDCKDRRLGCHSRCEKYLAFAKECEDVRNKKAKHKTIYDISPKCVEWLNNEIKRKQRGRK